MTVKYLDKTRVKAKSQRLPQVRSVNTRKKILRMAAKVIATEGMPGLRYANVAKMAKVPQALMGYHFPSLDSLLIEVIGQELEKLKALSTDRVERFAQSPKKALESYIRAPFDLAESDVEFRAVFTGFYHLAAMNPTFSELNASIRKMGRDRILNLVTMVLATEGYLLGQRLLSRENLIDMATTVQGIITGLSCMASTEGGNHFKAFADLGVASSFQVLGLHHD
jgi:AcrR family transcriptional regulator